MTCRRTGPPPTLRSDAYSKPSYAERCSLPSQEKTQTSAVASRARLRVALTPPDKTYRQLASITQKRDRGRSETSTPPPGHRDS